MRINRIWAIAAAVVSVGALVGAANVPGAAGQETSDGAAAPDGIAVRPASEGSAAATEDFWTAERLASAEPMALPEVADSESSASEASEPSGVPSFQRGTAPGGRSTYQAESGESGGGDAVSPAHSFDANADYPGPFQRWTWFGRYTTYPTGTYAKVFFQQDHDGNGTLSSFVCSGEVFHSDVVHTAGHCVNNGLNGAGANGGWSGNVLVCPSWRNQSGGQANPAIGCWADESLATSNAWFSMGNPGGFDRDWGAIRTASAGTVHNAEIGNITGWLGWAANFGHRQVFSFGYPQGSPFNGNLIIACAAPSWYTRNLGIGADSLYIGCDKTGGTSGGPWILGLAHPNGALEFGSFAGTTDGLACNCLYGVNSHRRTGFNNELASPQFTTEAGGWTEFRDFLFVW